MEGAAILLKGTVDFPLLIVFLLGQFIPRLKGSNAKISYLQETRPMGLFCEGYKLIRFVFTSGAYPIDVRHSEFSRNGCTR